MNDATPYGTGGDHCPWCGRDWKAPHDEECPQFVRLDWTGLTIGDTLRQSIIIHPDWTVEDHNSYITCETAFEVTDTAPLSTPPCSFPPGCHLHALHGEKLCFDHFISLGMLLGVK